VDDTLQRNLMPGEQVAWSGKPATGVRFGLRDIFLIPFSVLWGGFAISWEVGVFLTAGTQNMVASLPFLLFGGAFVAIGLFMIFGRFLVDAALRGRTRYALTNQRVLIARGRGLSATPLKGGPQASLRVAANGEGSILFGAPSSMFAMGNMAMGFGMWIPALDPTPQFAHIADAQKVFGEVQRQIAAQT